MNREIYFKLRPSLFYISLFGIITFALGWAYNNIPEKLSSAQKQLLSFVGAPAITLGFLAFIHKTVTDEVEELSKSKLEERISLEMKDYKDRYSKDLQDLKEEILSLEIPDSNRKSVIKKLVSIETADQKFLVRRQTSKDIVKWLSNKDNKLSLLNTAISNARSNHDIPHEYEHEFDKDMRECILWLKYSLDYLKACHVDPQRHTSAMMAGMLGGASPYETALNAIKEKIQQQGFSGDTSIVVEMSLHLIKEIKALSTKNG